MGPSWIESLIKPQHSLMGLSSSCFSCSWPGDPPSLSWFHFQMEPEILWAGSPRFMVTLFSIPVPSMVKVWVRVPKVADPTCDSLTICLKIMALSSPRASRHFTFFLGTGEMVLQNHRDFSTIKYDFISPADCPVILRNKFYHKTISARPLKCLTMDI